ncbi:hypothetical protein ACFL6Y_11995, partial [Elusimicrobiota bacterium]
KLQTGRYWLRVRAQDELGNTQTSFVLDESSMTFYVDRDSPTATITFPVHDAQYLASQLNSANPGPIYGSASDPQQPLPCASNECYYGADNPSLQQTQYKLWFLLENTSYYWYGGEFVVDGAGPETQWQQTSGVDDSTSTWDFDILTGNWVSDRTYYLQVRSSDMARDTYGIASGNVQDSWTLGGSSFRRFIVDNTAPNVAIGTPIADGYHNGSSFEIHGTALGDEVGLKTSVSSGIVVRLFYTESGVGDYFWDPYDDVFVASNSATAWEMVPTYSIVNGTVTWNLADLPSLAQFNDTKNPYKISAYARDDFDAEGRVTFITDTTMQFRIDKDEGTIVTTVPVSNAFYGGAGDPLSDEIPVIIAKPLNAISGTSVDLGGGGTPSGIDEVRVGIQDFTSGNYWNGADAFDVGGGDDSRWRLADGDTDWQYQDDAVSDTFPTWQGERKYRAYYKMTDTAGNPTLDTVYKEFTWDISVPTSTLITPPPNGSTYIKSLPTISGTASDNSNTGGDTESGILSVEISIEQGSDSGIFWRVSDKSWQPGGTEIWNSTSSPSGFNISTATTGDTQWYMTGVSTPNWVSSQEYRIRTRVVDQSNNISRYLDTSSCTFTYDPEPPVQGISFPNDATPTTANYNPRLSTGAWAPASGDYGATISGTASDPGPSGLKEVKIRIYDDTLTEDCWVPGDNYSDWVNPCQESHWYIPTTTNTFEDWYSTFTFTNSDRKYRVEVRSEDNAGNFSVSYSTVTFMIDRDVPLVGVTFPADGSSIRDITNSYNFITGTAKDAGNDVPGDIATSGVKIGVRQNSDGQWWNGAGSGGSGAFDKSDPGNGIDEMDFPGSSAGTQQISSYTWQIVNTKLTSGTSYYI